MKPTVAKPFFRSDARGGIVIAAALTFPAALLFVGVAVDYTRMSLSREQLQSAADAAALEASKATTRSAAEASLAAAFAAAKSKSMLSGKPVAARLVSFTPGTAEVAASMDVTMTLSALSGQSTRSVAVKAAATTGRPANAGKVLDIAMCIDATGSMQPVIDSVKNNALNFAVNLNAYFTANGLTPFDLIRARPIFFRDFGGNNPDYRSDHYKVASGGYVDLYPLGNAWKPAGDSRNYGDAVPLKAAGDFYKLPAEAANFQSFVSPERESGGGDYVESGIECLNEAIDSNWLRPGGSFNSGTGAMTVKTAFSVVAIWTDEDAHPPSFSWSLLNANYPNASKMPRTYASLKAKWDTEINIPQANKLLAFFKPSAPHPGWAPIQLWNRYLSAGTLTQGTNAMVNSIGAAVATLDRAAGSPMVRLTK